MDPILLVGQAPSSDGATAFQGRSGRHFCAVAGIDAATFAVRFTCVNLFDTFPGKAGKGDAFPLALAMECATRVSLSPVTLLAGGHVTRAFRLVPTYFAWQSLRGCAVAVIPHPSRVNRWWNDPRNVELCHRFLRDLLGLP